MSTAIEQVSSEHAGQLIHKIIGRLSPNAETGSDFPLPFPLTGRTDREIYAAEIRKEIASIPFPALLEDRVKHGSRTRKNALDILDRLALRGCPSLGVSRTQWLRLKQLALFCARPQDWACPSGPIIGARTTALADYLGVNDVNEAIGPLLKHGLIALWAPYANGRRRFAVINPKGDDETIIGAGWTLAPLILLLGTLERCLKDHEDELASRQLIIERARLQLHAAMTSEPAADRFEHLKRLSIRLHNAKKGRLSVLTSCCDEIDAVCNQNHSNGVISEPCREDIPATGIRKMPPELYNPHHKNNIRSGLPEGANIKGPSPITPVVITTKAASEDKYGLQQCDFSLHEIPDLFPEVSGLIDESDLKSRDAVRTLARISGIDAASATLLEHQLGREPAIVCLLLTARKSSAGELIGHPTRYLHGLLKRARMRDLNLGLTIVSMRKNSRNTGMARTLPLRH